MLSPHEGSFTKPWGEPRRRFFAATGHSLGGVFKTYWDAHGGLAQFGYPLCEEFSERNPSDGKVYTVQYFERARFEYHPENKGTQYEVLLGLLGKQVTAGRENDAPFQGVPSVAEGATKTYFAATKHTLSDQFKAYWEAHGGLAIYGYPISEPFNEKNPDDGKTYTVQYFERNRFELHPENAGTPYEVLLGQLGKQIAVQRGVLPGGQPATATVTVSAPPPTAPASAAPPAATTAAGGRFTVANTDGAGANLRDAPSVGGQLLQLVPEGTAIESTGPAIKDGAGSMWYPVKVGTATGFIRADFMKAQ